MTIKAYTGPTELEKLGAELAAAEATVAGQLRRVEELRGKLVVAVEADRIRGSKQVHIERINELLAIAKRSLVEAGEIGATHDIEFTFNTPKGETENFRPGWQSSACYASDGWYYHDDYSETNWNGSSC